MQEAPAPRRSRSTLYWSAGIVVALVAIALIAGPVVRGTSSGVNHVPFSLATIDPADFVPHRNELPAGTTVLAQRHLTNAQAAKTNGTDLGYLNRVGREVGFERDFKVPKRGEFDIEVVRFRSRAGMNTAYAYFLSLADARRLHPTVFSGVGEKAVLVATHQAAFVEFKRGRYYGVVTTLDLTKANLDQIGTLARLVDAKLQGKSSVRP